MTQRPAPEFSRAVPVESLEDGGTVIDIEADADERAALARRFGLLAVDSLTAKVGLTPVDVGRVRVHGALAAEVTQACVVTLEPVTTRVEASFERLYGADAPGEAGGLITDPDTGESPEPLSHVDGAVGEGFGRLLGVRVVDRAARLLWGVGAVQALERRLHACCHGSRVTTQAWVTSAARAP